MGIKRLVEIKSQAEKLIYELRSEEFYYGADMDHAEKVLDNSVKIAKEIDLAEDKSRLLCYGAILHDIGKSNGCKIMYKDIKHREAGARFIKENYKIKELLEQYSLNDEDIEEISEIIRYHKTGKEDNRLACIVAAADKLAHMEEDSRRIKKEIKKLEEIKENDEQVAKIALKIAKDNGWC